MKNTIWILILIFCLATFHEASAQLTKKEKKEWKKKQKSMTPADFKELIEENSALKAKLSSMNSQVSGLQSKVNESESKMDNLQREKLRLETQILEMKGIDKSIDVTGNRTKVAKGVVFRVQIGAYAGKDLAQFASLEDDFNRESAGEVQKYTLGTFSDYWEADKFKKYIRKMGVRDAWIVPYKDGLRVPLKDVLEGVI
jgi:septal ring factor EnvC (AmiA/AmiB activator)